MNCSRFFQSSLAAVVIRSSVGRGSRSRSRSNCRSIHFELLKPEPVPKRPSVNRNARPGNRYALKALENELAIAAQAPSGARNDTLNRSAHNLFRFVIDGELPADVIRDGLMAAAQHAGVPAIEAQSTIRSAARARGLAL
jgi:hypothetical protein